MEGATMKPMRWVPPDVQDQSARLLVAFGRSLPELGPANETNKLAVAVACCSMLLASMDVQPGTETMDEIWEAIHKVRPIPHFKTRKERAASAN